MCSFSATDCTACHFGNWFCSRTSDGWRRNYRFYGPKLSWEDCYVCEDVYDLEPLGLNDKISSLRVGRGEQWEVCEESNFGGRCVVVSDRKVTSGEMVHRSFRPAELPRCSKKLQRRRVRSRWVQPPCTEHHCWSRSMGTLRR